MADELKPYLKDFLLYLLIIIIVIAGLTFLISQKPTAESDKKEATGSSQVNYKQYSTPPKMEIDTAKKYIAKLTTNKGAISVELFAKEAPNAVNNFVFLAKEGFYDGTKFHRIVKHFMIQGGDPQGDGTGGPGYTFPDEPISRDYKRGIVAMANRGPDTNGSQFFIMLKDNDLPKQYVIFGQVTSGLDVIDKIAQTPVADNGMGEKSKPTEEVKIEKITIQ